MSVVDSSIDCVHQRIKRKLDDYGPADDEDFSFDLVSVRMRKDEPDAVNSSAAPLHNHRSPFHPRVSDARSALCSSDSKLQFFVRMISGGSTLVFQANSRDTVRSIHERIQSIVGIPVIEQRLIYRGKQLQWEQSLADCSIENDAGLQLVGRMRSTEHPQAWQAIDQMVSSICRMCKGESVSSGSYVKAKLIEFLTMTPRGDSEQAAGHLQIFISSCAPAALVMLYMRPDEGNKKCGDDLIRQVVTSISMLPKSLHQHCAPILLEFCKLLRRTSPDDAMYSLCRSSLGSMVEYIDIGLGTTSKSANSKKFVISFQDVFPFVSELAAKLTHVLTASVQSKMESGSLLVDVHDFTSFLLPVIRMIDEQVVFGRPISTPFRDVGYNVPCPGEEINFLYAIFCDLLEKMDLCLGRMEECLAVKEKGEGEVLHLGWCQYLAILKQLNNISRLYQGAEKQFWTKLMHRKVSFCYLIIRCTKRNDHHIWLLEHKEVTNFECRRHLAMMLLPEAKDEYEEVHEMLIDRPQLLAESFEYIARAETDALRAGLFLEFKNEEATGPGVLREWFFLVCQAIFNPQNALFVACPNDRRRFFPNPASKVDPLHLEYFNFSGRVIALALMHKVQIGIVFDRVFFLQLAGMKVSLEDIRDADPFLYSSCKKILEMDPETVDQDALGLTFVREIDELGSRKIVELCPDGKNIVVNCNNRREYVDLLIQHCFVTSIAEQVTHFAQGFTDIIISSRIRKLFFRSLELEDLDWMLHGSENAISIDDWKAHTEYNGYKETDPQISWFWKTVRGMSAEQRKVLLFFWTSVKYLPIEGFGGLASRLYIYKSTEARDRLPSSHTCFYRLCLPPYPSLIIMQDRLNLITQEHVSCSFGTW